MFFFGFPFLALPCITGLTVILVLFCFFVVIMFVLDKTFALVVRYISLLSTEWFSFVSVQNIHRSCWVLLERFLPYLRALVLIRHLLINTSTPVDELDICSLNVRGLSNTLKRRETFRWLRMKKFLNLFSTRSPLDRRERTLVLFRMGVPSLV